MSPQKKRSLASDVHDERPKMLIVGSPEHKAHMAQEAAKKKPSKKPRRKNAPRTARMDANEIRQYATLLEPLMSAINTIADTVEHEGFEQVLFDGVGQFDRGVDSILSFIDNLHSGVEKLQGAKQKELESTRTPQEQIETRIAERLRKINN